MNPDLLSRSDLVCKLKFGRVANVPRCVLDIDYEGVDLCALSDI